MGVHYIYSLKVELKALHTGTNTPYACSTNHRWYLQATAQPITESGSNDLM